MLGHAKTREAMRAGLAMYFETRRPARSSRPPRGASCAELGLDWFVNVQFIGEHLLEINPRISTIVYQDDLNLPVPPRTFPEVRQEILELLIEAQRDFAPEAVLMPTIGDIHQDHHTIAAEGLRAFKRTTILGYEIPWNQFSFAKQAYVVLEERHLEAKVRALECYQSQQHRNYANEEYIRNLARTHGIEIGRPFAECFEVVRWVV